MVAEDMTEIYGVAVPESSATDFTRKAEFAKLAFWLRAYGNDEEMASFIEAIATKKNFVQDYRVQTRLLKLFIKVFKAAEKYLSPSSPGEGPSGYVSRFVTLKKEVTTIRTEINRLLNTTHRGTKRKLHGGTRDDSRGSPDPG